MKTAKRPERIIYFDYLRILASFAVVMVHVAGQAFYKTPLNTTGWHGANIFDGLVRWCVPVFIMISGALFLSREQKIGKIFKKNILRLVTAFIFWALIYVLWQRFVTHEITSREGIITGLVNGHYHMWFIPMIIGLYMASPILKKIVENRKIAWYFVILSFFFTFLIPQLVTIIKYRFSFPADLLNAATETLNLKLVLGYSGYFVLGYLLHTTDFKQKYFKYIYGLGALSAVLAIIFTALISTKLNVPTADFYHNLTVGVLLPSVAIFLFAKNHFNKTFKNKNIQQTTLFLSRSSFGVYLVHILIIYVLDFYLHFNISSMHPIFSVPVITIITIIISSAVSAILNKIPVINKYIV